MEQYKLQQALYSGSHQGTLVTGDIASDGASIFFPQIITGQSMIYTMQGLFGVRLFIKVYLFIHFIKVNFECEGSVGSQDHRPDPDPQPNQQCRHRQYYRMLASC